MYAYNNVHILTTMLTLSSVALIELFNVLITKLVKNNNGNTGKANDLRKLPVKNIKKIVKEFILKSQLFSGVYKLAITIYI